MSAIVNRAALHDMLRTAAPSTRIRTAHELLKCAKITAGDDRIVVETNNLTMCVRQTTTIVQVESPFTLAANCDRLAAVVGSMTGETIKLRNDDAAMLSVTDAANEFNVPVLAAKDFPPFFSDDKPVAEFTVAGKDFARAVRQTRFACEKGEGRYAMQGILIRSKRKGAEAVATDGKRLSLLPFSVTDAKGEAQAIVPAESAETMAALFEETESIRCAIYESAFSAKSEDAHVATNLIEGVFPPYEDIIPKDANGSVRIKTAELLAAARRCSLVSDDIKPVMRMEFGKRGIGISARSGERGRHAANMPCKYDGPDMTIGLNPSMLADALSACGDAGEIELRVNAPNRPVLIVSGEFRCVQMPVNLE